MKASDWFKLGGGVVAGALLAGSIDVARAGVRVGRPVHVSLYGPSYDRGTLDGSFADARSSPDGNQFLSVVVSAREGEATTVFINAQQAKGIQASCTSSDPTLVQAAHALADGSYVEVDFVGTRCTKLQVENASHLAPKQPLPPKAFVGPAPRARPAHRARRPRGRPARRRRATLLRGRARGR